MALILPVSVAGLLVGSLYSAFFLSTSRNDPVVLSIVAFLMLPTIATVLWWLVYVVREIRRIFRTVRF